MCILRPDKGIHSTQYNDMEYRYIDFHFQVVLPESEGRSQPVLAPSERNVCTVASRAECSHVISFDVQLVYCARLRRNAPYFQVNFDTADVEDEGGSPRVLEFEFGHLRLNGPGHGCCYL